MEENKNDIDELVKSIDSSFREMSLKDIVAAHEDYFGADNISFDENKASGQQENIEQIKLEKSVDKEKENESTREDMAEDISESTDPDIENCEAESLKKDEINSVIKDEKKDAEKTAAESMKEEAEQDTAIKEKIREKKLESAGRIGGWFQTFCYMRIPVIGFIYILVLAFSKKTPEGKKEFARGYILYKVLVWILAIVLLYCLYKIGLGFVDGMLSFLKA